MTPAKDIGKDDVSSRKIARRIMVTVKQSRKRSPERTVPQLMENGKPLGHENNEQKNLIMESNDCTIYLIATMIGDELYCGHGPSPACRGKCRCSIRRRN